VEYDILREALRAGIHPSLIPQMLTQPDRTSVPSQHLSPMSPVRQSERYDQRHELRQQEGREYERGYPTSSLTSYARPDLPRIDTNLPVPIVSNGSRHLVPSQSTHYHHHRREKVAGPISAPPASMATTSPPPSIFFRHWAPPGPRTTDDLDQTTTGSTLPSSSRYIHHTATSAGGVAAELPSPNSARKTPPSLHAAASSNGISPKRTGHGRQRSEAALSGKGHDSRHHPYSRGALQSKKDDDLGLGGTKSNLDRETVMRALREKVAPRREEEKDKTAQPTAAPETNTSRVESVEEKKEVERRKVEQTREAMALDQLVEATNGAEKE